MDNVSHDFRGPTEINGKQITPYSIDPLNPQKRLRVLSGWLLDDVVQDINLSNFEFHVMTFCKQCDLLEEKYPIHQKHISEIRMDFWARVQQKHKLLKAMQAEEDKLRCKFMLMQDLDRLGF